jgi:hypothetical protein
MNKLDSSLRWNDAWVVEIGFAASTTLQTEAMA